MLPILFSTLIALLACNFAATEPETGYGSDLKVRCAPGLEIFGVFHSADNTFAGSCVEPQICNQYFPTCTLGAACGSAFTYVYEATEKGGEEYQEDDKRKKRNVHGRIQQKCCVLQPPVNEDLTEVCEQFSLSHTEAKKIDLFKSGGFGAVGGPSQRYVKYMTKVPTGYFISICYIQCSRTTTTRRPTTEIPEPPQDILGEDFLEQVDVQEGTNSQGVFGDGQCFPEDGSVLTPGGHRRMDQLVAGDKVLTHSDTFGGHTFEPILFMLHREPETVAQFLQFTTSNGLEVQMTESHMIPVLPCDEEDVKLGNGFLGQHMKPANQVTIGTCLLVETEDKHLQPVVSIRKLTRRGIYNPVTASGTIVVNGVHCGVYLNTQAGLSHFLTHSIIKFFQLIERFTGYSWDAGLGHGDLSGAVKVVLEASTGI